MKGLILKIIGCLSFMLGVAFAYNSGEAYAYQDVREVNSQTLYVNSSVKTAQNTSVFSSNMKCRIKVNGTLDNGVKVEGEIIFEGVNIFQCAALKIADLLSSKF